MSVPPLLVFGYGNPSRGDDALGPELVRRLESRIDPDRVELLTDFQLQIEHALDLRERQRVLLVDASREGAAPFVMTPLRPQAEVGYTTHQMVPAALLAVYQQVRLEAPPPCELLAIRGYRFELGEGLSPQATANLEQALIWVGNWLRGLYPVTDP